MTRPPHFPEGFGDLTSRDVTLADGTRLRLVESGAALGRPVLLVHGFGASAYQWRFLLPALASAGYRGLAPDLPGHGFSQLKFDAGQYSRGAYATRLWLLLDALGLSRVPIVGHSMGGAVAAEMAWQRPERVTRLALLSPAGFGRVLRRARVLRRVPDALAPLGRAFASSAVAHLVLGDVYGPEGSWTKRDKEELLAPYAQREIYRAMLRTLKEFDFRLHPLSMLERLPEETLVLFGTHDRVVRPAGAEARVAAMRRARLVMLPRVGHLPQVEAAEAVARLLLPFLLAPRVAGAPGAD